MLECNRRRKNRRKILARALVMAVPVLILVVLLSQTVFARNTFLINDGGNVILHTTYATDPGKVLDEAGLTLGQDDYYVVQEGDGMAQITVQRRQTVSVSLGGETRYATSYGETVNALLKRLGITLTEADQISVDVDTMTYDGMALTVTKASVIEESYIVTVPYKTVYCYDPTLPEGQQTVLTQGIEGQLQKTDKVFYIEGEEVGRTGLTEVVVRRSVNAVVAIGTGEAGKDGTILLAAP